MRNVFICFAAIVISFIYLQESRAENVIYGNSSTGPQPFGANTSGQMSITLLSGEDQTNGVFKVEHQYSRCLATADTVCKATVPAFVHAVWCYGVDAAATAGRVRLVDDATVTGTAANEIWGAEFAAALQPPVGQVIDQAMARGIEFDFTTTNDVTCVVSYR